MASEPRFNEGGIVSASLNDINSECGSVPGNGDSVERVDRCDSLTGVDVTERHDLVSDSLHCICVDVTELRDLDSDSLDCVCVDVTERCGDNCDWLEWVHSIVSFDPTQWENVTSSSCNSLQSLCTRFFIRHLDPAANLLLL